MRRAVEYLALFFIALPITSHAQSPTREIEAKKGEAWHHQPSGLHIPSQIFDLPRGKISDYSDQQLNIMASFGNAQGTEILSLYIFRPFIKSSPIWHDRAQTTINYVYFQSQTNTPGIAKTLPLPARPDHQALLTIYQFPEDANRRSTGLATVEVNGWMIKARYTSVTLTLDAMAQRLTEMLTRFDWPDITGTPTAAAFLQPCAAPIEWTDAKPAAKNDGQAIVDAYFAKLGDFLTSDPLPTLMVRTNAEAAPLAKSPTYCRAEEHSTHSIYRPVDATDRYILAYGDAGESMNVARSDNSKNTEYRASYSDFSDTFILPRFQSLPTPDQIVQLVNEGNFPSKVDSAGIITIVRPKNKNEDTDKDKDKGKP